MVGRNIFLFFIVIVMIWLAAGQNMDGPFHNKVVVCYVASSAAYPSDPASFDLDPSLCTHLVYCYFEFDEVSSAIKSHYWNLDLERGKHLLALKGRYPHLKITASIHIQDSLQYSMMTEDPKKRAKFVKSVMMFLYNFKIDGIYIGYKGDRRPQRKVNYMSLFKELKEAFKPKGYILTAALDTSTTTMEAVYDLPKLSRYLDFIYMRTYVYHDGLGGVVWSNAPIKSVNNAEELSIEFIIKHMLEHEVSPSKMVLGLPLFGTKFILSSKTTRAVVFGQTPAKYTAFMMYHEICKELTNKRTTWTQHWDENSATPYLRDGGHIITYENARSIAIKVRIAIEYNLAGLIVWNIDDDDFQGACRPEVDPYVDFMDHFHKLSGDPVMNVVVKKLNLPDGSLLKKRYGYTIDNGKLNLHLPEREFTNYPLMRTINEAVVLAIEEKKIMGVMKEVVKDKIIGDEDEAIQVLELCSVSMHCEL